jgi:predicted small secreted protein
MMYNCLQKSISDAVFAKVSKEASKYRYNVNGKYIFDGPSYLMTIIELTYTNTKANITAARDNLSSLTEFMDSLPDSNIEHSTIM